MATEILATNDTEAVSSDIVIADGSTATIGIKHAEFSEKLTIEIDIGGSPPEWDAVGFLVSNVGERIKTIGPGTYRLRRAAGVMAGGFRA